MLKKENKVLNNLFKQLKGCRLRRDGDVPEESDAGSSLRDGIEDVLDSELQDGNTQFLLYLPPLVKSRLQVYSFIVGRNMSKIVVEVISDFLDVKFREMSETVDLDALVKLKDGLKNPKNK